MYDYLVVGAGFFGAVFAREMTNRGKRCLVIDRRRHIGGNCYTEKIEGVTVHKYGPHIFHTSDEEVWDYLNRYATFNNFVNSPLAVFKKEVYNLPFNMNTFSKMWNVLTPAEARSIISEQIESLGLKGCRNLEERALSLVGKDVYEKLIKGYTEKQWGRKCSELPAQIINRIPLRFTYDNNYFGDRYQGVPVDGYTGIFERLLDGIDVVLNVDFADFSDKKCAEKIIYCGCIDEFFNYSLGALEYRSLHFETEIMDIDNYQGNAVVNFTSSEVPYTRIIEHKHFEFGRQKKTVISREYPMEWKQGIEPYYPIANDLNKALYDKYAALADENPNVFFCGRLGEYKYYNMDQVIRRAIDLTKML